MPTRRARTLRRRALAQTPARTLRDRSATRPVRDSARPSREQTALHLAAEAGRLQIATELLSRGADVNARNKNNQTARPPPRPSY